MIQCQDEQVQPDTHPLIRIVFAGNGRRPDAGWNGLLDAQSDNPTFVAGSILSKHGVAVDADDAVCMLLLKMFLCNDSDRGTAALQVGC